MSVPKLREIILNKKTNFINQPLLLKNYENTVVGAQILHKFLTLFSEVVNLKT